MPRRTLVDPSGGGAPRFQPRSSQEREEGGPPPTLEALLAASGIDIEDVSPFTGLSSGTEITTNEDLAALLVDINERLETPAMENLPSPWMLAPEPANWRGQLVDVTTQGDLQEHERRGALLQAGLGGTATTDSEWIEIPVGSIPIFRFRGARDAFVDETAEAVAGMMD